MEHHIADKDYVALLEHYDTTVVTFGEGSFNALAEYMMLESVSCAAFIVGGHHSAMESGAHDAFVQMALGFDVETPLYRDVPPEPEVEDVRKIVAFLDSFKPEKVIAVGGGSVLDAAKAAYLAWQTDKDVTELFGKNVASDAFPDKKFDRIIAIPTTAGTGSEVTPYANIVWNEKNVKCLIMDDAIVPAMAFVDHTFGVSMPKNLTITTALDALVHSVESLLNTGVKDADPKSEKWGREAISLIVYALPKVIENPSDLLAREMLSAAATLGGMCIKARPTSLPHLASFSMYGKMPHGIAVASLLPVFWDWYLADKGVCKTTMTLAGLFPSEEEQKTPQDVVNACRKFISSMSGISKLSDIEGFDAELVSKIASDAMKNPVKLTSAPRKVEVEKAEKIIKDVLAAAL